MKLTAKVVLPYPISNDALDWLHNNCRECVDWMLDPVYYIDEDGTKTSDVEYDVVWFDNPELATMFALRWL